MEEFQERLQGCWRLAHGNLLSAETLQRGQSSSRARHALRLVPGATVAKFALRIPSPSPRRHIVARYLAPAVPEDVRCVVVYCPSELEGGAGAEEALPLCLEVLPLGIAVFALDLSPTKHSRCTVEDVAGAVAALRDGTLPGLAASTGHGCCVALWGRSAGAVAALQYAARDPTVAALVADSAYSDLTALAPVLSPLSHFCDMLSGSPLKPVEVAKSCFIPGFFLHGTEDQLVPKEAARDLRSSYAGEAQVLLMPNCSHDSLRPSASLARAALFLARAFNLDSVAVQQLDLYLTKLTERPQLDQQLDCKAEDLLRSPEAQRRHRGMLLKAVNACGYGQHVEAFRLSRAKGQQFRYGEARGVHFAILLQFRSSESELCIAWVDDEALESPAGHKGGHPSPVGTVHFVTLSCTCVRISRAMICQESRGHRVAVQDLLVKELKVLAREKPYCMLLSLSDFGRIDLKIGHHDVVQFPGTKDAHNALPSLLWTAALGATGPPPKVKDELLPSKLIPVAPIAGDPVAGTGPLHNVIPQREPALEVDASSLDNLPASAAELALQMRPSEKTPHRKVPVHGLEDKECTSMKKRYASELSNVAPSELSAGTFLSKADSLALSLSTVSDASEDDSLSSRASTSQMVRSQTWPDVKEPQPLEIGRRHSWAVSSDMWPTGLLLPGGPA